MDQKHLCWEDTFGNLLYIEWPDFRWCISLENGSFWSLGNIALHACVSVCVELMLLTLFCLFRNFKSSQAIDSLLTFTFFFFALIVEEMEWEMDDLRSNNWENGIQVSACCICFSFLCFSLFIKNTFSFKFPFCLPASGRGEMSQLWRDLLSLMQIARLQFLLWTFSKIHVSN